MRRLAIVLAAGVTLGFPGGVRAEAGETTLSGAGATFPQPLYEKWFAAYRRKTGVKVSYEGVGSGAGISNIKHRKVDFGASDAFLSDEELGIARRKKRTGSGEPGGRHAGADGSPGKKPTLLHLPTCLGSVAITYNLPGNPTLRLTPEVIADIFLGRITTWNHRRIRAVNPGVFLPEEEVTVVHRSDSSGTTFIFTDYLSKVSARWKKECGRAKKLNWPKGLGARGNPGVARLVKRVRGGVAYVEQIYATKHKLPVALVRNRSGNFVKPSVTSVSLAGNVRLPDDTRVSITDTRAARGYPISSFTWLLFYREQKYGGRSKRRARELSRFLWYVTHPAQKQTTGLHYAPLPKAAVRKAEAIIGSITYGGEPLGVVPGTKEGGQE